jgi:hypothetical protein
MLYNMVMIYKIQNTVLEIQKCAILKSVLLQKPQFLATCQANIKIGHVWEELENTNRMGPILVS